jgi:hypothetical protein
MPMRDIRKKYTKSEITIMAWRSSETAYQMRAEGNTHRRPNDAPGSMPGEAPTDLYGATQREKELEQRLGPVVQKLADDEGNVDLRRLTGNEALKYMAVMGLPIGGRA